MFNIITINKNNTAIAPTYMIKNIKPKKSIPNKIKITALNKKEQIKNKTELMGLTAEIINIDELIKNVYIIIIKDVYIKEIIFYKIHKSFYYK